MIDTLHIVETPEGVELELPVAGPVARLLAWILDSSIQILGIVLLAALLELVPGAQLGASGLMFIAFFLVLWFYGVAFEVWNAGRTPGKMALGLKVVREDGTPVDYGASILRNFLRGVDWLPYGYSLGFVCMLIDPSFRRVGDLVAGTLVVYTSRSTYLPPTRREEPRPSPIPLELDERRAIIAFASRARLLSTSRAEELAATATPLLEPGSSGSQAHKRICQIAAWLTGDVGAGAERPSDASRSELATTSDEPRP